MRLAVLDREACTARGEDGDALAEVRLYVDSDGHVYALTDEQRDERDPLWRDSGGL